MNNTTLAQVAVNESKVEPIELLDLVPYNFTGILLPIAYIVTWIIATSTYCLTLRF